MVTTEITGSTQKSPLFLPVTKSQSLSPKNTPVPDSPGDSWIFVYTSTALYMEMGCSLVFLFFLHVSEMHTHFV